MARRRSVRILALALALTLLAAASASAATQTVKKTFGPIRIGGYEVKQNTTVGVPNAGVDGYITDMKVNVVDRAGKPLPISRIMLHHVVFLNMGGPGDPRMDRTCGQFTLWNSRDTLPALAERFYAAGEERAEMHLPPGYGYRVSSRDTWFMVWMLMNHRQQPDEAYVQYEMTVETEQPLKAVTPYWLDVANCAVDPIYNVPGNGRPGTVHRRSSEFTVRESGRLVAGLGHVHGGGQSLTVTQPTCENREVARFLPTWGSRRHPFYNVRPILHEPGPIDVTAMQTPTGIPVTAGSTLALTSNYEGSLPHTRVMGIALAYVAPDEAVTDPCGALPGDITYSKRPAGRSAPPRFTVPLTGIDPDTGRAVTIKAPPGRRVALRNGATVDIRRFAFSRPNIALKKGARLTWRFRDRGEIHNVTLASGPIGFGSDNKDRGSFSQRFTKRGTYRIFCALHPVAMTESIVVK
ncbi:plastocyanin/azurin family copper-binding protein [Conexibacter arvalis]|uniref:Plastocyanin n=1 Tax=Conexibacter arvalis TaxID=912552 RepID=A0A840IEE2_9ACTN|nr:plastocyanin/azurin family copper-binding protein [Conexibacter arvalis]MBB4663176.1 plastocyanin [Conexibacter arvalis]